MVHLGHWCWDYIWSLPGRLPVDEILSADYLPRMLGGSVNSAIACAANDGVEVTTYLAVPSDDAARSLARHLEGCGVQLEFEVVDGGAPWTFVVDSGVTGRTAFAISGTNLHVQLSNGKAMSSYRMSQCDAVIYGYPCLTPNLDWASRANALVDSSVQIHAIDLNGIATGRLPIANVFPDVPVMVKGSIAEWVKWSSGVDAISGCIDAVDRGAAVAIATDGSRPPSIITASDSIWLQRLNRKVQVIGYDGQSRHTITHVDPDRWSHMASNTEQISTIGAGDAFLAGCVLEIVAQLRLGVVNPDRIASRGHISATDWMKRSSAGSDSSVSDGILVPRCTDESAAELY